MGIKDRRTKILMAMLLMSDDSFKEVALTPDICAVFDLTMNRKTLSTLMQLTKEEYLDHIPESNPPIYKLTAKGFYDIVLTYPVFRFTQEKWDGKWRILSYEIPEKKRELRDRLRREVASWGLGPWHRSFWVTPHPIIHSLRDLISDTEEQQYVQAFEADHVFGNRAELIEKVWGKTSREKEYRALFKTWHQMLSTDQDKVSKMKEVTSSYINILKTDPGLPKDLIGDSWIGFEAIILFREIKNILLQQSS
ncbi:hypothetical protein CO051_00820 [Candidatus Roizmanbacteria bacterium CG_4_9_14_0_2_um_filter_39_13]|uniref:Uncharacterized protein n=1 Tax=Candidatus Roizmanbacteria bacterium CG_4_9_14_0_2_um_filter_39_13 TaxID=1974839 RepID=A0A2M8F3L2_9BACT|nr:MAG: hypothetical protein COY15_00320 [Candidatus Roizmanbacteria bacterium CG_4_10_14_0_2_um_filter_39_12]PJC33878.1 MAG: hypothetical protein CO051_00820 [Candidatus Roizmanbacteria bacterium CG_4_9_14_0_2_um_filter_39_13]